MAPLPLGRERVGSVFPGWEKVDLVLFYTSLSNMSAEIGAGCYAILLRSPSNKEERTDEAPGAEGFSTHHLILWTQGGEREARGGKRRLQLAP